MGPLIPQNIISADLNFFFAFIIGIAFGFILEQAGFSSSRKLAGVFYGYDFVVLKVFFTAGFTAAIGVFFFQYFGFIDINFVYINPLYLWSAIIGGVIMGFGFILGGFCPGTGFAAAVIGKIDAIVFIIGIFIGVFIFGYFFNYFEPIYNSNFLGNLLVFDTLGISQNLFLFILIVVAVMAFVVTQLIQNSSTKFKELLNTQKLNLAFPVLFLFILAFIALYIPNQRTSYMHELSKYQMIEKINDSKRTISVQKLAYSIINQTNDIHIVDIRSQNEYLHFHLPGAVNLPFENILNKAYKPLLNVNNKITVLYSNGGVKANMAWFVLSREGKGEYYVLDGGLNNFIETIFNEYTEIESNDIVKKSNIKFFDFARRFFKEGEIYKRTNTNATIPEIEVKSLSPAKGGC